MKLATQRVPHFIWRMAPKFKIRADILLYVTILGGSTLGTLAFTEYYGVSEEDKLKNLRAKYPVQPQKTESKRQEMQAFFDKMKSNQHTDLDEKFDGMLKAGKGEMKRQYSYDKKDQERAAKASADAQPGAPATAGGTTGGNKQEEPQPPKAAGGGWGWW